MERLRCEPRDARDRQLRRRQTRQCEAVLRRGTSRLRTRSKQAGLDHREAGAAAPLPAVGSGAALAALDRAAARRGRTLFTGKARCANCHMPPSFSDAGWNLHTGEEICIDNFQSSRSPTFRYRTTALRGIVAKLKGGFHHDGRYPTLAAVVDHYDSCFKLGLTQRERADLVQYLRSR